MGFFKNPLVAVLLSLAMIAGSTLLSVRLKFGEACGEITDGFFNGLGSEVSIRNELKVIVASAEQIEATAQGYDIDASALLEAIRQLKQPLSGDPDISVRAVYDCYETLSGELEKICAALDSRTLSAEDRDILSSSVSIIAFARDTIENCSYNSSVEQFLRKHYRFPVTVLAGPAGVDIPEAFN